ncbi:hypothetical protein B0H14DRAFT_2570073 [Mycena olivaceomarginata]|nr:hypothetical protein B0H14DRAFT_2570073 [Mycena olivaceomarginata]
MSTTSSCSEPGSPGKNTRRLGSPIQLASHNYRFQPYKYDYLEKMKRTTENLRRVNQKSRMAAKRNQGSPATSVIARQDSLSDVTAAFRGIALASFLSTSGSVQSPPDTSPLSSQTTAPLVVPPKHACFTRSQGRVTTTPATTRPGTTAPVTHQAPRKASRHDRRCPHGVIREQVACKPSNHSHRCPHGIIRKQEAKRQKQFVHRCPHGVRREKPKTNRGDSDRSTRKN